MIRLAWRLAARGLRGGEGGAARGLGIVLACLTLGVAAVATVGSLRAAVDRGLAENARALLGGDLEVETGAQPPPPALAERLRTGGGATGGATSGTTSGVARLRSLLVAPSGERQLVALKAVDAAYPLVGRVEMSPAGDLAPALAVRNGLPGLLADGTVLDRLGVRVGGTVRLGLATFRVAAVLRAEPDRTANPLSGPPVLIAASALPGTGLIQPGSMVEYATRVRLPPGADATAAANAVRAAFPDTGWRIRDEAEAAPGVGRFVGELGVFLSLVALAALLVGGIGVATGVRAWLEARARDLATLRCLGASSGLVLAVVGLQLGVLAGGGILTGLAAGAALVPAVALLLGDTLPLPAHVGLYPRPLLLAGADGLLLAAAFALWPLVRAASTPPLHAGGGALFRDAAPPAPTVAWGGVRGWPLAANAALAVALAGSAALTAAAPAVAGWFCAGAATVLAVFRLGAWGLVRLAPRAAWRCSPAMRLGLDGLHRPGNATALLLASTGLGLTALAAVALVEGNIQDRLRRQLPADAPSFYFIDIQPDQRTRFEALIEAMPGARDLREVPALRARIVAVDGIPAERVDATPDTRWALRGDRGLSYAAAPPPNTRLVAGAWWPPGYAGPPLVSLDAGLARGWHVGIGGVIRVNVLGRDLDLRIASLRDIAWRSLGLNFAMLASPEPLAHAPHTVIATIRSAPADDGAILRAVTDALPNVTGIRVADILAGVSALARRVAAALDAAGSVTLASGLLVLAGAVAAGQPRRRAQAVVLRALGATAGQLRLAWMVEFGAVGLLAGMLAAGMGTLAGWAVVRFALHAPWRFLPGTLFATVGGSVGAMLACGAVAAEAALRARPGPMLRNE